MCPEWRWLVRSKEALVVPSSACLSFLLLLLYLESLVNSRIEEVQVQDG